jgi:hypothetical protein
MPVSRTIEQTLLARDRRGVAALASSLPADYCVQAARFVLERPGPVLIVTGFYILAADAPETDGPAGALVLGNALEALDYPVGYVTDRYTAPLLKAEVPQALVHTFPMAGEGESGAFAEELLAHVQPTLLVAIERCGRSRDGLYRNMRGEDISPQTARTDELFLRHAESIGIGDGGNEIGMGNLHDHVLAVPSLVREPCIVQVRRLVIAAVANWGAYGLVAALSRLTGRELLPSVHEHGALLQRLVALGAVDGITAARDGSVDGFSLAENLEVLAELARA